MKNILLFLCLLLPTSIYAQKVRVISYTKLQVHDGEKMYHPNISPQGDYILYSDIDYKGLKEYVIKSGETKEISNKDGAGYQVQIDPTGQSIIFRENTYVNNRKQISLHSYQREKGLKHQILSPCRTLSAYSLQGGTLSYIKNRHISNQRIQDAKTIQGTLLSIEDLKMVLYTNTERKILAPNGDQESYFWASLSPDQKHIVYTVARKGTFVSTLDGKNVYSLGHLGAPKWIGNEYIIGMNDKDNGEYVTTSTVDIIRYDGTNREVISKSDIPIAMYPSATTDGKKVVFHTEKGEIYLLELTFE